MITIWQYDKISHNEYEWYTQHEKQKKKYVKDTFKNKTNNERGN